MDLFKLMTLEEIAAAIDFPLKKWRGYCFIVVRRMLNHNLVKGVEVSGPSPFAEAIFHFWIRTPSGDVVDPTRWCYEGATPYIHVGPVTTDYREQPPSSEPSGLDRILGRSTADNLRLIREAGATSKSSPNR